MLKQPWELCTIGKEYFSSGTAFVYELWIFSKKNQQNFIITLKNKGLNKMKLVSDFLPFSFFIEVCLLPSRQLSVCCKTFIKNQNKTGTFPNSYTLGSKDRNNCCDINVRHSCHATYMFCLLSFKFIP